MNYVSCEAFMNFCDNMMIEDDIAEEVTLKSFAVEVGEIFRTVFIAIQRLLNNIKRFQTIVMPKQIVNSLNKVMSESARVIVSTKEIIDPQEAQRLDAEYQRLSQIKEYENVINFDASGLKSTDYGKFNSSVIVKSMNLDLKYMQKRRMTANIKEANKDRGAFDGKGAGNASGYRALQKIHMMRYKVYQKICSFKIPGEYDKEKLDKYNVNYTS